MRGAVLIHRNPRDIEANGAGFRPPSPERRPRDPLAERNRAAILAQPSPTGRAPR